MQSLRKKISLYYHTLKYYKIKQIYLYIIKKLQMMSLMECHYTRKKNIPEHRLNNIQKPLRSFELSHQVYTNQSFTFLNKKIPFGNNWFPKNASHLWLFNLHYFNYLFEINTVQEYESIILSWINNVPPGKNSAWHPYPVSLRICNWIWTYSLYKKILSHQFKTIFLTSLWNQSLFLLRHLETDKLGNHLLENCQALILSGIFFNELKFLNKGLSLLKRELKEQLLSDGGHYERSPMYHTIVLEGLINCYLPLKQFYPLVSFKWLKCAILKMACYLAKIINNGKLPLFHDSAYNIARDSSILLNFVHSTLGSENLLQKYEYGSFYLKDSGYFVHKTKKIFFVVDIGKIGPDFSVGHSHNGLLSYILALDNTEIITDAGIYEYETGVWRNYFRATKAHNTIMIENIEQNQIWSNFKIAKRGKAFNKNVDFKKKYMSCSHDCYKNQGVLINRQVNILDNDQGINIIDTIYCSRRGQVFNNNLHFSEGVQIKNSIDENGKKIYFLTKNKLLFSLTISNKDAFEIKEGQSWESTTFGEKHLRLNICIKGVCKSKKTVSYYTIKKMNQGINKSI